jgi:integrase
MSARHQDGYLYEVKGSNGKAASFHVRYRVAEIVDGVPQRVQRSHKLADRDEKFTSLKCKALLDERKKFMLSINGTSKTKHDPLVSEFWEKTYLPHLQETSKASTLNGYLKLYKKHLSPALAALRLSEVDCPRATVFLTSLVREKKLGRRSLAHVQSLASGMFRHAKQLGLIPQNPFTDAESLVSPKAPKATHAYTLDEAMTIIEGLSGHPQEQMVFVLATFCGLRPGEISALKWADISGNTIYVNRAAWRGVVGTTKTPESVAPVPLAKTIRVNFVETWQKLCQPSVEGWCFPNRNGDPTDLDGLCRRIIGPLMAEKKIPWHGLYAGRRAAASLLTQLTGNALAGQYLLRQKSPNTTETYYIKLRLEDAAAGARLLDEKLKGKFSIEPKVLTS